MQQQQMQQQQAQQQEVMKGEQEQRAFEMQKHTDEVALKREEIELKRELGHLKEIATDVRHSRDSDQVDTDDNGVGDYLDLRRTDIDETYKQQQVALKEKQLAETARANKAKEEIQRKAANNKPTVK